MASPPITRPTTATTPPAPPRTTSVYVPSPVADADTQLQTRRWWRVIPVVALGLMLGTLDQSAVGVANAAIADVFGVNNIDIQAVGNAHRISMGITIPAAIWLCSRFGLRRIFLFSMVLYAVTSALCGLAGNLDLLIAFRVLQGIPAALCAIACIAILQSVLPKDKQGPAMLLTIMLVLAAPGFSPVIGGYLVTEWHWRWVFFIVVPFALFGLIGGLLLLPPLRPKPTPPFDWPGFLCIATAITTLTLALVKGTYWGWTSYPILILFAVAVDASVLFVIIERQVRYPLIDQRAFRSQPFVVALVMVEFFTVNLAAMSSFMPPFLQQVQGMTALESGLLLVPQAIAWILAMPVAGIVMLKLGIRWSIVIGGSLFGATTILLSHLMVVTTDWTVLATVLAVRSVGLAVTMLPLFGGTVSSLPPELMDSGTMVRTMVQRIGAGLTLSAVSGWVASDKQQVAYDRSLLLDPEHAPALHERQLRAPDSLLGLWQQTQGYTTAQAYSTVFLVIGWATIVGVVLLAFVARWGQPPDSDRYAVQDGA